MFFCGLLIAAAGIGLWLIRTESKSDARTETIRDLVKLHESNAPALHNVYRLGQTLYSGGSPDEEGSFDSLKQLGIKTIISVDGAPPDVEAAKSHGMRYVHLPITYSSVPHETLVGLMRASKELPGPIYVHCHHGKHRGPAAAVALWRCMDKSVSADQADAAMRVIGTSDRYQGLFDSVRTMTCPTAVELNSKDELPESSHVPPLAKTMAEIDRMWDQVKAPSSTRNSTTTSFELTMTYDLAEQFREAARLADVPETMHPDFQAIVDDLDKLAETIKVDLRDPSKANPERAAAVTRINQRCDACHDKYRN